MKIKKFICILISTLSLFALAACGGGKTDGGEPAVEYDIPAYADDAGMRIGGYCYPAADLVSPEIYADAAAAGVNLITVPLGGAAGYNMSKLTEILGYCNDAGVKALVSDTAINLSTQNFTNFNSYSAYPAFYGNHLVDEPNVSNWPAVKKMYDAFAAAAPGKLGLININEPPEYTGKFEKAADDFMTLMRGGEYKIDHLSYDMYPLIIDSHTGELSVKGNYFTSLEIIKRAAVRYGVSAHNYILSVKHEGQFIYPQPTEASLRWQLACSMAFGYESFTHFTYWPVGSLAQESENGTVKAGDGYTYWPSAIDRSGGKTEIYGFLKTVNSEALAWDHVYLKYAWRGISALEGSQSVKNWGLATLQHKTDPDEIDGIQSIASTEDALCGIFGDADGNRGFMLTNASNPYDNKAASIEIRFDAVYKGVQIFERGVPKIYELDKDGKTTVGLESGEGKFLIPLKAK